MGLESFMPLFTAMALMVVVVLTVMGLEYTALLAVGGLPLVV
jgi:hypothetical protein